MPWVAICERLRPLMGRNENQDYVNVVVNTRQIVSDAGTFVTNNPTHPWADSQFNEFIVDLTDQEAADINNGVNPLFHDGQQNQPRWQQSPAGSASTKSFGSYADPEIAVTFTADVPLPDDRFIVRLYNVDPATLTVPQQTTLNLTSEDLDEEDVTGFVGRWLKLYNSDDTANTTNAQDQKTEIGGKLMIFDFTAGVSTFNIGTTNPGVIVFPSNHRYRVVTPSGAQEVIWTIFGRTLEVES